MRRIALEAEKTYGPRALQRRSDSADSVNFENHGTIITVIDDSALFPFREDDRVTRRHYLKPVGR